MKKNFVCGVAIAGFMTIGLIAQTQTQPQDPNKNMNMSTDRKVTVQGCLERDMSSPTSTTGTTGSMAAFKLTQIDVIKDEPAGGGSNVAKDVAKDTSTAAKDVGKGTADVATAGQYGQSQKDKTKDISLEVTPTTGKNVDLASQVNHKVELVGTMSADDVAAARGKSATGAMTPIAFKATSIKSIADKCQ